VKITIKVRAAGKRLRPSYRRGVEFIALNLDFGRDSLDEAAGDVSIITLAEAFDTTPQRVARDVRRCYDANMKGPRA
jgi:hypothetical protein